MPADRGIYEKCLFPRWLNTLRTIWDFAAKTRPVGSVLNGQQTLVCCSSDKLKSVVRKLTLYLSRVTFMLKVESRVVWPRLGIQRH